RFSRDWSSDVCSSDLWWSRNGGSQPRIPEKEAVIGGIENVGDIQNAVEVRKPTLVLICNDTPLDRDFNGTHSKRRANRTLSPQRSEERRVGKVARNSM